MDRTPFDWDEAGWMEYQSWWSESQPRGLHLLNETRTALWKMKVNQYFGLTCFLEKNFSRSNKE